MKTITKTIMIKRRLIVDDDIREFIFENINYRRRVYNDFVEESRKYKDVFDFRPLKFKTYYFNEIEKPLRIYDDYCVGISEQVAKDIKNGQSIIKGNKKFNSKLQFKKFDRYHGSFKVHLKPTHYEIKTRNINFNSRLKIKSNNKLKFRIRKGDWVELNLKESLFESTYKDYYIDKSNQYYFTLDDVKEISFIHDMNRFYIILSVNVTYIINEPNKITYAGIDLGIRNPITLYDGYVIIQSEFKMDQKTLSKIEYLENRIKKLQNIMDRKFRLNGGIYSNNYEKVRKKFLITHRKIFNIKLDWRRKTTLKLAKTYNIFVIDNFKNPKVKPSSINYINNRTVMKKINHSNRRYCMSYVYNSLVHNIEKLGGTVIQSPDNTTSTCSNCGHINDRLPLYKHNLICECCGTKIDRDINASINCYNYISSLS